MAEHEDSGSPIRRFIASALIVIGVLWMSGAGLCSVWMFGMLVSESSSPDDLAEAMLIIASVGGFSLGLGFVVYVVGKSLRPLK